MTWPPSPVELSEPFRVTSGWRVTIGRRPTVPLVHCPWPDAREPSTCLQMGWGGAIREQQVEAIGNADEPDRRPGLVRQSVLPHDGVVFWIDDDDPVSIVVIGHD